MVIFYARVNVHWFLSSVLIIDNLLFFFGVYPRNVICCITEWNMRMSKTWLLILSNHCSLLKFLEINVYIWIPFLKIISYLCNYYYKWNCYVKQCFSNLNVDRNMWGSGANTDLDSVSLGIWESVFLTRF